ncbi:DUF1289 domain-containing protein, partial [Klebsiella sp. Kpp]|nr:DUF1289 domain-containing protein [Klebsiella sp. Kpp]
RTIDEIASWSTMNDAARLAVWKTLPERACAWLNDAPCA